MKKILQILQNRNLRFGLFHLFTFLLMFVGYKGTGQNLTQSGFTGVIVPQYMASGTSTRLPVMFRATVSGLTANTSYRYYTQGATNSTTGGGTVDFGTTNSGAGNPMLINSTGTTFTNPSSVSVTTAGGYETFTTDATGNYTGWFGFVNTGNARFTAGNIVYPSIVIASNSGTILFRRALDLGITVLAFSTSAGTNNGSFLQSPSSATAKNIVTIYDNTAGTGRPLSTTVVESIGVTIGSVPTIYSTATGTWNTIMPNTNINGVRRIEQRSVTDNSTVGCATDADGIWATGNISTVNPTNGVTSPNTKIISNSDAPLNVCPIAPVITSSLTATGTVGTVISNYTITASNSPTTFAASNLPGGLTFTSPTISGTPTNAGTFNATISATNTAGSDTKTLVFTIGKGNQTITGLSTTDTKIYGDANYLLSASSSSGLAISYSSSNTNVATIAGNTVTIVGNGTTTITASQAGDANYNPATSIDQTLTVNPKTLTIATPTVPNKVYDGTNTAIISGTLVGIVGLDVVSFNGTGTFSQVSIGTALAVTSTATLSGVDAAKYILTQPTGLTANIITAPLTISGLTADNKVYDRTTTATFTGTPAYVGLVNNETFSVTGTPTASFATASVGTSKTVTVAGYNAPSTNYSLTQPSLTANITAKPLTVTGATAANKIYDGNANAVISGASLAGVISPDDVSVSGNGTFASASVADGIPVTTSLILGGLDASNYSLTQPTGLTANITQKPLTITGLTADNKVFDGNTTATLSGTAALDGIVSGDEANVTLSGTPTATFAQSAAGNGIVVTVTGYSITGSASGNYSVSQPTGLTANITNSPPPVINSALTATATYGVVSTSYFITATNSPDSYNATGLPTGLSINTSTGEISGTPTDVAGSPFSVTISATNNGGTGTATLVYTITPKTLTVSSPTVPNKVYDRTNAATILGTLSGVVGSDVVSLNGTGTFSQIGVGSNLAVTSTSTLSGADAAKYSLTQPTGLTGNIVVKPLTVLGATASNKIYDGNVTATLTGATLNGIISPDDVTLTGGAIFSSADVANNISINTSSLTLGGADAANYIALPIVGLTGNITTKSLTISGLSVGNKVYDGNTTATLTGTPTLNGIIGTDDVSISGTATANFNTKNIGTSKPITVTGYTLSGTKSGNYTVSQPSGLTANITVAPVTILNATANNKIYDGNDVAILTGTLSGVVVSETVTLSLSGTFSQVGVGTGLTVISTSTIAGTDASNYSLTQPTGLTANITAKPLTITGLTANNKVFDGTTTATLSGTAALDGIVSGDEPNVSLAGTPVATFAQSAAGNGIAVTVTGYSITGSASGNYSVSQPAGLTANITNSPPPVINSALTATATYGVVSTSYFITATNSPDSYNATGLPTGLSINTSTGEISGTPTDVAGSPFSVTISATNNGGTGTATLVYTITPKTLTVSSPTVPNKVYDRTNAATILGTLSGVVGSDVVSLNGTGTFSQIGVGSNLVVTSTSTLSGADAPKYSLTQPTGLTGNIVVKPLMVSGASVSPKIYDGTNTATLVGGTLGGIVSPDVVTLTGGATFSSVNVANNISINTSSLTLGGTDAANYIALPIVGLTGNITVKPLTISGLTANNKVFDGTNTATLSGTAILNGVVGTDNVTLTGTPTATFDNRNIGTAKPVTITGYSLTGSQSGNYSVTQPAGLAANITALALTVTNPVAQNKVFDGNTNAIITGTLAGVISPDVVTFTGTGTFALSTVGNSIAVTSTSTLGGGNAGNYTLTQPTGLTANITAPQFTTGNLVVVNVNSTNVASLIEYTNSGSLQQTFAIPSTGTDALTISYTATSEGALSRSPSGYYLGLVGYRTGTNGSATDRVIARVNSVGIVNAKSVIPNAEGYTGNNIRAAVFNDDGSRFWTSGTGTGGGVRTNVFEATSGSVQVSTTVTNTRAINIFNNQLYVSSASGTFHGLSSVGTGLPTNTGNTITILPGFSTTSGPSAYGFAINPASTIAYVADDRASTLGGIQKWTFSGGTWTLAYTFGTGVANIGTRGLTVDWTGANPVIYATTAEANLNRIIKITDTGASSTPSTLATSSANNIFRGIAFSPILAPTSVSLSVSSNAGTEAGTTVITVTATASAPVVGNQTVSLGVTGTNITAGDYTLSNSTITIPNGSTMGSVTFTIVDDVLAENTETAILTLSNPSSGVVLGSPITQNITITDNDNTAPTIAIDVTTTSNYVDGGITVSPASSFATSGVLNDPTDPAKNFGIDFTIGDAETAAGSLTVTATSSNVTVLPNANLNLTGSGASRNLKITPNAEGFANVTVSVNDGITTTSFIVNYASSNASINTSTTRFHTGTSDASTAQVIDNNLMIMADDENQALRLYNRQNSGLPVNSFDFTTSLGLTDVSGSLPREVDIEASAKVGNRIYWMGSHSNASSGNNRPNRSRFFATDISGVGNATTLSYVGRYDNLKTELLAWDANNGHGLGANFLGLAASAASGKIPEIADGSGFNIEGFEIAPNNSTAYICFRAPLQTTTTRTKALIIPLTNFANLVSGNPTTTTAIFGNPIQLDLGGRAIREMKKNASGEYLIIAGPHDGSTGIAPKDFRFYTWTGNPSDAPILRSANLTALNANGSFESIVDLPSPLVANSNLQVLVDNGDAVFYGDGTIAKELPQNNHKKFRSETINLGSAALAIGTLAGTSFCENAPISVPFTTTETFNSGNIFTAQLSDASGSFANPVSIGTLTGTVPGTINATIPIGTVSGSGYRIRVVSSNLVIIGADNGINLTINNCTPLVTIKSIITGNWESPSTWDLGRVPQAGDLVIIDQNHEVTLNGTGTAKKIQYQGTGKLKLSSASSILNTGL